MDFTLTKTKAQGEPKLYGKLAPWFHLLTDPAEYREEAEAYSRVLINACKRTPKTVLELGSGVGNMAYHMKNKFHLTLTDVSRTILEISKRINPETEHVVGDMRTLRLGRQFDAIFVHDAICYMTSRHDLLAAMRTAFLHCRPGGAAVFVPDFFRENFRPHTDHGGHDGKTRSLRYLEWTHDPNPNDTTYSVDYSYLLREKGKIAVVHDRHIEGLFSRTQWLALLRQAGFSPLATPPLHGGKALQGCYVIIGVKNESGTRKSRNAPSTQ